MRQMSRRKTYSKKTDSVSEGGLESSPIGDDDNDDEDGDEIVDDRNDDNVDESEAAKEDDDGEEEEEEENGEEEAKSEEDESMEEEKRATEKGKGTQMVPSREKSTDRSFFALVKWKLVLKDSDGEPLSEKTKNLKSMASK